MSVKITELPILDSLADNDVIAGVDVSGNVTSKIEMSTLKNYIDTNTQYTAGTNIDITNNVISAPDVYNKDEMDNQIEELQNEVDSLSTIFNAFPTESDEDESMTLDGTAEVKFKKFDLKGNTSQTTYSGKNLFDKTRLISGKRLDNTGLPSIADNTYCTTDYFIKVEPNTTYYSTSVINQAKAVCFYDNNQEFIERKMYLNVNTFTTGATTQFIKISILLSEIDTEQLEKGSSATTYEPYVGGTASPNPNYPQPVNVVSGDNEINICGENLFHSDGINLATLSGITSSFDNSSISLNGSNTSAGYVISNRTATNITLEAGTYYFSIFLLSGSINRGSNQGEFTIKTSDGRTGITLSNIINSPSGYTKSFTATEKTTLETDFYLNGAITFTNAVLGIEISKQTPTTYEPYQGNTYEVDLPEGMELCKIGNYQDYIYKDSDKWYLHKVIGKYNIDTSTLGIKTNYTNIEYATITKPNNYLGYGSFDKVEIICKSASHIAQAPSGWNDANLVNKISGNPEANRWWLGFSKGTGITAIQNALNGSYIYYPLTTPTNTEITYTPLIEQLNLLEKAMSKDSQTNISQVNNDLGFIIYAEAIKSLENVLDRLALVEE